MMGIEEWALIMIWVLVILLAILVWLIDSEGAK